MNRPIRGLTLIELLVVLSIIATLAGIGLAVAGIARNQARWVVCTSRIENLRQGLAAYGLAGESGAVGLLRGLREHRQAAGGLPNDGYLGLVRPSYRQSDSDPANRGLLGAIAPATDGTFTDYAESWQMRFPPGEKAVGFWAKNPYVWAGGHSNWQMVRADTRTGIRFHLYQERPASAVRTSYPTMAFSAALSVLAGIAPDVDRYASDRGRDRPWNDPWGNPLLIAFAFFQYGPANAATAARWPATQTPPAGGSYSGENPANTQAFTEQWKEVRRAYGTTQSVYLAFGAVGPRLPEDGSVTMATPLTTTVLEDLWYVVNTVCNQASDGSDLWCIHPDAAPAVDSFAKPPWQGLRRAKRSGVESILALPMTVK